MSDLVNLFYNSDPNLMICNFLSVLLIIAMFSAVTNLIGSVRR